MATVDSNGLVLWETTDPVSPLQTLINGSITSVSNAFNSTVRVFNAVDSAAQSALLTSRGATTDAPLATYRVDTGKVQINDGTGWKEWYDPGFDTGWINLTTSNATVAGGVAGCSYRRINRVTYFQSEFWSVTAGTLCTLPIGFRPPSRFRMPAQRYTSSTNPPPTAFAMFNTDGTVTIGLESGTAVTAAPGYTVRASWPSLT